ncbi:MAG: hypothetical protein HY592_02455 [Candidatus Omnitrophica bacterium]|nr:hypothetical protein [Candidatus Omnitrophota bacterium]
MSLNVAFLYFLTTTLAFSAEVVKLKKEEKGNPGLSVKQVRDAFLKNLSLIQAKNNAMLHQSVREAQASRRAGSGSETMMLAAATMSTMDTQTKVVELQSVLQASSPDRANVNLLYGTNIQATGSLSATDLQTLSTVTSSSSYTLSYFLAQTSRASNLYRALQANSATRADFNLLYWTTIPTSGPPASYQRTTLIGLSDYPTFDQAAFLGNVNRAAALYRRLQWDTTNRNNVNTLYGTTISTTGYPGTDNRKKLMGITSAPGYTESAFFSQTAKNVALYKNLQSNSTNRANVNLLYGTNIQATGASNTNDIQALTSITGANYYGVSDFVWKTNKAAGLYKALQASSVDRDNFNLMYNTNVPVSGSPDAGSRSAVVGLANMSGFTVSSFLADVAQTANLYRAIQADEALRESFNFLYGTAIEASGTPGTDNRRALQTIVRASGYDQPGFISQTVKAVELVDALSADAVKLALFNEKFGANLVVGVRPTDADRNAVVSIVNASGYELASFLHSLEPITEDPDPDPTPKTIPDMLFSDTSFWKTHLTDNEQIHSNSANYVNELIAQTQLQWGTWINTNRYSTPLYIVDSSTQRVPVSIVQNGVTLTWTVLHVETQKGVPIPVNALPAAGTDGHITIYDKSTDTLYEFWKFQNVNGQWQANWGGIIENASQSNGVMPIKINANGSKEYWGATASGLPAIGGTMLLEELAAGVIEHALAFAIPTPKAGVFVDPANRTDGTSTVANAIPEGMTFRFPADTQIDPNWTPMMKMMVTAVRDYGMILRDRAGAVVFYGEDWTQYGSTNPYTQYYGGKSLTDVMKEFPWDKLQVVA